MLKIIVIFSVIFLFGINLAYGQEILITVTPDSEKIVFDGKWTFKEEWKRSSQNVVDYDDGAKLFIRSSHDYDNIYIMINFVSDKTAINFADKGMVCFDGLNDGGAYPQKDDYCIVASVGSKYPKLLQGGSTLAQTGFFKNVESHPDLIAVGGLSDNNDRYSGTPHITYEFKIPLEIFGKTHTYGFYLQAYDADKDKVYSWPQNIAKEKYPYIAEPEKWGKLISPDKSIPEFNLPILLASLAFLPMILLTRLKMNRLQAN